MQKYTMYKNFMFHDVIPVASKSYPSCHFVLTKICFCCHSVNRINMLTFLCSWKDFKLSHAFILKAKHDKLMRRW